MVGFHLGRVDRPPEGGLFPPPGVGEGAPPLLPSPATVGGDANSPISPDDLLRFLDSMTAPARTASSSSAAAPADAVVQHHLFNSATGLTSTSPSVSPPALASGPSPLASDAFSLFPSKDEVALQHLSTFAAPAKAFDAGDMHLPFDLKPLSTAIPSTFTDVLAFPVSGAETDAVAFDASLDSPLGLDGGSSTTSPLSEFLASPMFSLPPSAAPSSTFSELPLPSLPSMDPMASSLPWFPPLPTLPHDFTVSTSTSTHLRPSPPLPASPFIAPPPTPSSTASAVKKGSRSKPAPTGFRNASTPLLAMDAPIQSRNSAIPSATSRKRKTAQAERALAKRKRADESPAPTPDAGGDEEALPADIVAAVERKRLQNTLSARKSRARKQARLQELETENEALKDRVAELERLLGLVQSAGRA
ncbi:hypothetical protein JCM10207_002223 [Rhodosporidiobolus poonsookiae]